MPSVLFVCLGNICRSPLAEGVFRHEVAKRGLAQSFTIDSAGTGGWHAGEPPDPRAIRVAKRHGVDISDLRARQVRVADFDEFDHLLAMDRSNLDDLLALCPREHRTRVRLLRSYDSVAGTDVPDPYFCGPDDLLGFEQVFAMVERCSDRLLTELSRGLRRE